MSLQSQPQPDLLSLGEPTTPYFKLPSHTLPYSLHISAKDQHETYNTGTQQLEAYSTANYDLTQNGAGWRMTITTDYLDDVTPSRG